MIAMKNEMIALRDRLNAALGGRDGVERRRRFLANARPEGGFKELLVQCDSLIFVAELRDIRS